LQPYKLTIFRQSRVLFGLFLLPFAFIGLLLLGFQIGSFILGLFFFVIYLLLYYYFTVGHLTISIENEHLNFSWKKKVVFNYKQVDDLPLANIRTIVIDNGRFLRKLITDNKTVFINTTKVNPNDNLKLIHFLQTFAKNNNIRVINSWRNWADNGYLKTAYKINIASIVIAFIIVCLFIARKGFSSWQLSVFLLFIPQLFLYGQQMNLEMKEDNRK